jgi:DNA-binding response OmpR family regulator
MPVEKTVLCIGHDPVSLNLRCLLMRQHGWNAISSGSGHDGVIRFGQEAVDAVVIDLDGDGSEAALITGELKRLRPKVPVIIVVADERELANGATQEAASVILKSQESRTLVEVLKVLFSAA